MRHSVEHTRAPGEVRAWIQAAFDAHRLRYTALRPTLRWLDDERAEATAQVRGLRVRGRLTLQSHSVTVDIALPRILRPLEGRLRARIDREVAAWVRARVA